MLVKLHQGQLESTSPFQNQTQHVLSYLDDTSTPRSRQSQALLVLSYEATVSPIPPPRISTLVPGVDVDAKMRQDTQRRSC